MFRARTVGPKFLREARWRLRSKEGGDTELVQGLLYGGGITTGLHKKVRGARPYPRLSQALKRAMTPRRSRHRGGPG